MFQGLVIDQDGDACRSTVRDIADDELPEGDVTIRVSYSSMNYKDALAVSGTGKIIRSFPMVPGVDLVGVVEQSSSPDYAPGDWVIANGWGIGEGHWGGMAQYARLKSDWLIPLPLGMEPAVAMAIGTAGYTAMLSAMTLERLGLSRSAGPVVVTGAAGGVGSLGIVILSKRGYAVTAVTGRLEEREYLERLGASEVLNREELTGPARPLQSSRWAGALDTVGGTVLANVCAQMRYRGIVTACGLVGGMQWPATVAPFILRGVTLAGIDSVRCPFPERVEAWRLLAKEVDPSLLEEVSTTIGLGGVTDVADRLLKGAQRGRVIVDVNRI